MSGINPREVAAEALMEIVNEGGYNNLVLKRTLRRNGAMDQKDRAFVTELVNGALRNLTLIDYTIGKLSTVAPEKMKPFVLSVVRCGVYQIMFMDRVPDSAAVNEAVKLIKKRKMTGLAPFVNGVLRSAAKGVASLPYEEKDGAKFLALKYSHPLWAVKEWLSVYPFEFVREMCGKNNTAPGITIAVNTLKTDKRTLMTELFEAGLSVEEGRFFQNALRIGKTSDMTKLPPFEEGLFHVQDEASMAVAAALSPQPGQRILDLCAAPGGKSLLMAEMMQNTGEIISRDISETKLGLLTDAAERLGVSIIKTERKDAEFTDSGSVLDFHKVLIDAPCSGLGLLRKKPDIRYVRSREDMEFLAETQRNILKAAAEYPFDGGELIYSTCTLCREENQKNIRWFMENFPYEPIDLRERLPRGMWGETAEKGCVELYPHVHDTDGFFIAAMKKRRS